MDYALLIGCSRYDDPELADLRFAAADAVAFGSLVRDVCEFPIQNVQVFHSDAAELTSQPTRANILRALVRGAEVREHRRVNRLYVFFSGHGIRSANDGLDYLLPQDSIARTPELNAISFPTLQSYLDAWGARNVVVFCDACRSFPSSSKAVSAAALQPPDPQALCPEGMVTFTSCKPGQAAYESNVRNAGIFTAAIADALSDVDKQVTVADLDAYLRDRVPQLSAEAGTPRQDPLSRLEPLGVERLVLVSERVASMRRPETPVRLEKRTSYSARRPGFRASSGVAGVDFGTSFSAIALLDDSGQRHIVPAPDGSLFIPSAVSFFDDLSYVVGWEALERLDEHPELTVRHMKRRLGTRDHYSVGNTVLSPEAAASLVLRSLRKNAEEYVGTSFDSFVASAPANFSIRQVNALAEAFALSEMPLLRIIGEPDAATYLAEEVVGKEDAVVLIADLGGGTFDVCVAEVGDGVLSMLSTSGSNHVGGMDYDDLVEAFARRILWDQEQIDWQALPPRQLRLLRREAERVKADLGRQAQTTLVLTDLQNRDGNLRDVTIPLDRNRYREITDELNTRVQAISRAAIGQARLRQALDERVYNAPLDVVDLILVTGQGAKIFTVSEALASAVPHKQTDGRFQESAVVSGLALHAGVLSGSVKDTLLLQVRQRGLGLAVSSVDSRGIPTISSDRSLNSHAFVVLHGQMTIPTRQSAEVVLQAGGEGMVVIDVVEEPFLGTDTCEVIGNIVVPSPLDPSPRRQVTFDIDAMGTILIAITDGAGQEFGFWQVNNRFEPVASAQPLNEEREQTPRHLPVLEPMGDSGGKEVPDNSAEPDR